MPTPQQILETTTRIATDTRWLALLWHAALLVALLAFFRGWRPTRRGAGYLLAAPIASVGIVSLAYGSPFNGLVFSGLAIALVRIASRMPAKPVTRAGDWQIVVGHFLIGFGALYPHFLGLSPLSYLFAAPFGTIPCATLSVVLGFTLLSGGFSKSWNLTVVFFSVFYGTIGMVQLAVWIDITLVIGALLLSYTAANLMYRPRFAT